MNELAKKAENGVGMEGMLQQADLFVKSGFFPKHIDTKEKAVVVMLKGRELGLPFTEALSKICVINGVATTKVETLLGLARRTGQMEDFKQKFFPNEINPEYCEITIKRRGQSAHVCRFGDTEAKSMTSSEYDKASGTKKTICLLDKDNYKKQKATMYSWRAISKNLRVTFPDAIGGLYLEEEIADDVVIRPATEDRPAEVTEILEASRPEVTQQAKPSDEMSGLKADDIPAESLPNWTMPMGKYAGKTLLDIYSDKNETGKPRGKEYLEWCSRELKDEKNKAIITRFLELMQEPSVIDMDK